MNLGRKLIQQISSGRFVSARRGGDAVSSTDLSKADRFIKQNYFRIFVGVILVTGYFNRQFESKQPKKDSIIKANEVLKRAMEENGVTREYCEAKIAELKQNTESLPMSERDRFVLQIYEIWLRSFPKRQTRSA